MIYLTGQANNNDQNSKSQTKTNRFEPIFNLSTHRLFGGVLGICDFSNKSTRQSHLSLIWPKGPGFSRQNKFTVERYAYCLTHLLKAWYTV